MEAKLLISVILSIMYILPATAQNNYTNSEARVINQSQTGLALPSSTYIGAGTMSKSAQGLTPGTSNTAGNPLLPRVNMGANIHTPGDNLYQPKSAPLQKSLPPGRLGAHIGAPGDNLRSDLHYYLPGQNQKGQQNHNPPPQYLYQPGDRGVATYANQGYDTAKENNVRRF